MNDLLAQATELDAADPLAEFRDRFVISGTEGSSGTGDLVYLDGNSLGRLPKATRERMRTVLDDEWGTELVRGWDHWITLAREAGDALATGVLGVEPGEVLLCDTASINLYKLAEAACDARPGRSVIITDDDNFPSDQYVLQGVAYRRGMRLEVVRADLDRGTTTEDVAAAIGRCAPDSVALISLQHVAYRSGNVTDLVAITRLAHDAGALVLWDLCHSAGAVPTPLREAGADLAVGCTYKHLNGGPGAPGFLFVRGDLHERLRQPIWGWFGQTDQFAMGFEYRPVPAIERFQVSTTPVLAGYAALEGIRLTQAAGVDRIWAKTRAMGAYAEQLYDAWLAPHGLALASPRGDRGAHITLHHPAAWQMCQAWKAAGVIPDFRTPNRLRIGFAPLYTTFAEIHEGFARLRTIVASRSYEAFPVERSRVT